MNKILGTEFFKLKRAGMIWVGLSVGFFAALFQWLRIIFTKQSPDFGWTEYLTTHQEFMMFGILFTIVCLTCYLFSYEYQMNAVTYLFSTPNPRWKLLLGKFCSSFAMLITVYLISCVAMIGFGFLLLGSKVPSGLLGAYIKVSAWSIMIYTASIPAIAALSMLVRRFVVAVTIVLGYIVFVFPFHVRFMKFFICPVLYPALVAVKILNAPHYYYFAYPAAKLNFTQLGIESFLFWFAPLLFCFLYYQKADV